MGYISTKLEQEFPIDHIYTIHYFEYLKNFIFGGESHDFWELLYVDKGEIFVQADDRQYTMSTGDIIFHKPNEFHAFKATGNKAPNLVAISFVCSSPSMNFFENKCCSLQIEERRLISQIITEAKSAFLTPLYIPTVEEVILNPDGPLGGQELILLYLRTFLIQVRRSNIAQNTQLTHTHIPALSAKSDMNVLLNDIIQYMEFCICDKLSVEDICRKFSVSRSTLHSLFHKNTGCGAIDYFNSMKIQRAQDFMRDGTMNFTEIAHYLSYSSLQYFSKQFKKATGMSPLEYSNSIKKYSNELTIAAKKHSSGTSE